MELNKWNVFRYDSNSKEIYYFDVFTHHKFMHYCMVAFEEFQKTENLTEFKKQVKKEASYYFWAKSEHEILIRAWCGGTGQEEIKVDIYEQLCMNWEAFITQLIIQLLLLKEKEKVGYEK